MFHLKMMIFTAVNCSYIAYRRVFVMISSTMIKFCSSPKDKIRFILSRQDIITINLSVFGFWTDYGNSVYMDNRCKMAERLVMTN